jgi:hypothetical protein
MGIDQRLIERIQQLIKEGEEINPSNFKPLPGRLYFGAPVNEERANRWATNCLILIRQVFGKDSEHYEQFSRLFPEIDDWSQILKGIGLLESAKSYYESGFIASASDSSEEQPRRIFISHGRSPDWHKAQAYIERDIKIETLELAQEANRGRTVLQKLNEEANRCSYAVIVMTGDDEVGEGGHPRVRENVMHEIGFFQGKYGLANVCLLYEEGTNIPSNIHGLVYIPYPKGYVDATFGALRRELEAAFSEHK